MSPTMTQSQAESLTKVRTALRSALQEIQIAQNCEALTMAWSNELASMQERMEMDLKVLATYLD